MAQSLQEQIAALRTTIAGLEAQRSLLGDAIIGPALSALQAQLAVLEAENPSHAPQKSPDALPASAARAPRQPASDERRLVTVLFADVAGSTAMGEQLDPEDITEVMNGVFAFMNTTIARHGGLVTRLMGDAVLALFGAGQAHEDDPERAVRAGLEIQAEAARYARDVQARYGLAFQVRVGIHTGLALLATVGDAHRAEFTAMGDTANVAARLQSAAPPGSVLISEDTYRYVRGIFDLALQPPLTAKGKSEPMRTYLVEAARARPFRAANRGVEGVTTLTIGREVERDRLRAAYRQAIESGRVVWAQLIGEAGVGKSRLLADMEEWIHTLPKAAHVLRTRASEGDANQPFALIRRLWFDRFSIAEDVPVDQAEERWVREFRKAYPAGTIEAAQALGMLLGLPFAGSAHLSAARSDPSQVKGRALVVSRDVVTALRHEAPLVLLLEDLHWTDAASWEYLVEVLLQPAAAPECGSGVFVLATARPDWNPPAALSRAAEKQAASDCARMSYLPLHLSALGRTATRELVEALLCRVAGVPETTIDLIIDRSEGLPYFAEELVNLLIDRGVIDQSVEPWRYVPERMAGLPLPATLQHLLHTRLIALPEAQRVTLQRSAVYGRNFWEGGLRALGVTQPGRELEPLQPRGFVEAQPASSLAGEREWSFHHNLLREATYESILKRERPALHRAAAAWLEEQARRAGRLDEFAGWLGEHMERADDQAVAAGWYMQAGEGALARGAPVEARRFFDRALQLLPPTDRAGRWRALLGRDEVWGILGEPEARRSDDAALLAIARESMDPGRLAEAYYRLGTALTATGSDRQAVDNYAAGLIEARQARDQRLQALILGMQVTACTRVGMWAEARVAAEQAVSMAEAMGDDEMLARMLANVSVYYSALGDLAQAAIALQRQIAATRRLGNRGGTAIGLGNLGYNYVLLGLYTEGRAALEEALALARALGYRRIAAYQLLNLAIAHLRSQDIQAAERVLGQAIPAFAVTGDTFGRAVGLSYLGLAYEQSGNCQDALQHLTEAAQLLNDLSIPGCAYDVQAALARCAMASGDARLAQRHAEDLWHYLISQGPAGLEFPIWAYVTCAQILRGLGQNETAQAAVEAGYVELMRRAGRISDPGWRASFLEKVPEHGAIRALWHK